MIHTSAQIEGYICSPEIHTAYLQQSEVKAAILPLLPFLREHEADRLGIFTQTLSGGGDSSIAFWQEALDNEPRFANPRIFPWALPSSLAGFLAIHLGIKGPNFTFVGGITAWLQALDQAMYELGEGTIDKAILVSANTQLEPSTGLVLLMLSQAPSSASFPSSSASHSIHREETLQDISSFVTKLFSQHPNHECLVHIEGKYGFSASLQLHRNLLSLNLAYGEEEKSA
ncbi:MAG: beta-ketoacyl synthase N-terminal-like domain-containing protein [Bacteroidota bacterium]